MSTNRARSILRRESVRRIARALIATVTIAAGLTACAAESMTADSGHNDSAIADTSAVDAARPDASMADAVEPDTAPPTDAPTPPDSSGPGLFQVQDSARFMLSPHGGTTGTPFNLACSAGMVMVGVVGSAGSGVDAIAPRCAPLGNDGTPGTSIALTPVGGTGGTHFDDQCPSGQIVVGLVGGNGDRIDRIAIQCASVANWVTTGTAGTLGPMHGSAPIGSSPFTDRCPVGYAIKALAGRSDTRVTVLQTECVRIVPPPTGMFRIDSFTSFVLPQHGSTTATPFALSCSAGSVVVGIAGRAGSGIDAIATRCAPVMTDGTLGSSTLLGMHGGSGGTPFDDSCPANQIVVGLIGASGALVDQLSIQCAPLISWVDQGSLGTVGTLHGTRPPLSSMFTETCPVGYVYTQFEGGADTRVDTLITVCTRVSR